VYHLCAKYFQKFTQGVICLTNTFIDKKRTSTWWKMSSA